MGYNQNYNTVIPLDVQYTGTECWGITISPCDLYMALSLKMAPYGVIYKRGATEWTKILDLSGSQNSGAFGGCQFSPDGKYLAFGHGARLKIFRIDPNDVFTPVFDQAIGTQNIWRVRFGGDYLAVALGSSPYLKVYEVDAVNDTFTPIAGPSVPAPSDGTTVDLDISGSTVVLAGDGYLKMYEISGAILVELADLPDISGAMSYRAAINPAGDAICISLLSAPYFKWWRKVNGVWVTQSNPTGAPAVGSWACRWSVDGDYLYVSQEIGDTLLVFSYDGTSLTKVSGYYNDVITRDPLEIEQSLSKRYLAVAMYLEGGIVWESDFVGGSATVSASIGAQQNIDAHKGAETALIYGAGPTTLLEGQKGTTELLNVSSGVQQNIAGFKAVNSKLDHSAGVGNMVYGRKTSNSTIIASASDTSTISGVKRATTVLSDSLGAQSNAVGIKGALAELTDTVGTQAQIATMAEKPDVSIVASIGAQTSISVHKGAALAVYLDIGVQTNTDGFKVTGSSTGGNLGLTVLMNAMKSVQAKVHSAVGAIVVTSVQKSSRMDLEVSTGVQVAGYGTKSSMLALTESIGAHSSIRVQTNIALTASLGANMSAVGTKTVGSGFSNSLIIYSTTTVKRSSLDNLSTSTGIIETMVGHKISGTALVSSGLFSTLTLGVKSNTAGMYTSLGVQVQVVVYPGVTFLIRTYKLRVIFPALKKLTGRTTNVELQGIKRGEASLEVKKRGSNDFKAVQTPVSLVGVNIKTHREVLVYD